MADTIFNLKTAPSEADAERLVEVVERITGVTDATVDPRTQRLFVTFDTMRTGDLEIGQVLARAGFAIAGESEVGFMSDQPGYTREADVAEQNQAVATRMTRDEEIDLDGGLGSP